MIFFPLKKIITTLNSFRPNIIKVWTKFRNKIGCRLKLQLHSIYFLLDVNVDKLTFELHFFSKDIGPKSPSFI